MVDDILRTGDQPRVDEEVEVVEAFRQHVESEREEMMTALEQVKAEEYVLCIYFPTRSSEIKNKYNGKRYSG